ncbi:MAG: hypothetical protein KA436_08395 [Oligoflexales bacterium]|nr:hypothetical protein [Oligoflexales bacterium]
MKLKVNYLDYLMFLSLATACTHPAKQQGFDKEGKKQTCSLPPAGGVCTMLFTPEDEFANRCRAEGFQVLTCGCHSYLCSSSLSERN